MQSVKHMSLIGHVGEYFNAFGGTYVVPNGVTDGELTFQANDGTISDNLGSIEFDVEVCNYGEWRQDFYFDTGAHGWYAYNNWATLQSDGWHAIVDSQSFNKLYLGLNLPSVAEISAVLVTVSFDTAHDTASMLRGKTGANWTGNLTFDYSPGINDGYVGFNSEYGQPVANGAGTNYILYATWGNIPNGVNILHHIRLYGRGTKPNFS
jgi:hypothetical protein